MPGTDVDHHVTLRPFNILIIQHQRAFAFKDEGVIDSFGLVHAARIRVVATAIPGASGRTDLRRVRRDDIGVRCRVVIIWLADALDHAQLAAFGRRREVIGDGTVIGGAGERRGAFGPHPQIGMAAALTHRRRM